MTKSNNKAVLPYAAVNTDASNAPPSASARLSAPNYRQPNRVRRTLVGGLALGYASLWMPGSFAADITNAAVGNGAASATDFLAVSSFLTGRNDLDATRAGALLQALVTSDAQFATQLPALAAFIAAQKPDPLKLQGLLDAQKAPYAALPRQIVTAWYIGVVGAGKSARCLTYVSSLMNLAVGDHLRPPSYAYGAYGTWAVKPA